VRFSNSEKQNQASGHAQQLPTAVIASQAQDMMGDPLFAAQEKANGERRTIEVVSGRVRGINKLGLYVNLPENLEQAFSGFGDAVFDGEQVGAHMHVFDLLSFGGKDMRALPFGERYQALDEDVLGSMYKSPGWPITLLQAAFTESDKRALFERIQELNGEGLVFKRVDGAYEAGRSKSVFKYKFIESCTCVVLHRNLQRSVGLALYDANDLLVPVGNVTVPQNFDLPKYGNLVEVQYLYYNPEGAFEQPVYLGPRVDVRAHEANLKQVTRLKPGVAMDELGRRIKPESEEPLAQVMPRQRGG
jgi:bifunctional non-homologous end joining protein LigD